MRSLVTILLIFSATFSPALVLSQTPASQQDQDEVVRFRTNEVKLDVVVKDKKGRPIKDLKASDFEVVEDGVTQKVESFRFVARDPEQSKGRQNSPLETNGTASTTVAPKPVRSSFAVTALVFDRLSPEARGLARKAALSFAQEDLSQGDYAGVFGIDQSLRTIQNYTDSAASVKEGVERATGSSTSTYVSGGAKIRENTDRSVAIDREVAESTAAAAAAGAARDGAAATQAGEAAGQAAAEQKLLEMQSQMLDHYERLERDQEGFATINSLLAVILPMQNLPGRKTVIFFSEGLKMPPAVQQKFPAVINAANRANVSIYAIDASGLRVESGTQEAKKELDSLVAGRMQQQADPKRNPSGPLTRDLEKNEDLLRYDPRSGLGTLADETGGFLIHDTNDLSGALRRIDDDMNGYYLMTYVPQNKDYDGRFRQVNVKVNRSNVEVQSRKGYYAVESLGQIPVLDFEAPAIAAARNVEGKPQTSFHGAALSYPSPTRSGLTLLVAETPIAAFKFVTSRDNKTYSADFSIVGLIRDGSDQIVQKVSQHYPLSGDIQGLDVAKKESILFYRELQLPPGKYKIELIAYDGTSHEASISTSSLEVMGNDVSKPRLSSVAVLKRAERLSPEEQKQDQPFRFGELLVYPNLGERIDKNSAKQLAFFFTAWSAKGSSSPMKVTLEILRDNKSVGKTTGDLPPADTEGQIKYASSFPLDKFQSGKYELKVTISDGKNNATSSTQFTLA